AEETRHHGSVLGPGIAQYVLHEGAEEALQGRVAGGIGRLLRDVGDDEAEKSMALFRGLDFVDLDDRVKKDGWYKEAQALDSRCWRIVWEDVCVCVFLCR